MFQNITQVILLMIPNGEGLHYITVKKLPTSLRGILWKNYSGFYCLNCLYSFAIENKREYHKKVGENKDFCNVVKLPEDTEILEFNQYQKSDKASFIICADLECLIQKINGCKNNPENSFKTIEGKHIPSRFSVTSISSFKSIGNKHDVCKGKVSMKTFCESLREHSMEINRFKKKESKLLTKT